jgi:hypothetical protein
LLDYSHDLILAGLLAGAGLDFATRAADSSSERKLERETESLSRRQTHRSWSDSAFGANGDTFPHRMSLAAGGWRSIKIMRTSYQQADVATINAVVENKRHIESPRTSEAYGQ